MTNPNRDKPRVTLASLIAARAEQLTVTKVVPPDPIDWARQRMEKAERQKQQLAVTVASANGIVPPPLKKKKREDTLSRPTFKNFADKSVIDAVRRAMAEHPRHMSEGAKSIGLDYRGYVLIVKLLTLKDQHIPKEHREKIEQALTMIEADKRVAGAERVAQPVIAELWRTRKVAANDKKDNKRFEQTLIHISESCESTRTMTVPRDLSKRAATEAVVLLAESVELIGKLISRLSSGNDEEGE